MTQTDKILERFFGTYTRWMYKNDRFFRCQGKVDKEEQLASLITDLLLWADANGIDADIALMIASNSFTKEIKDGRATGTV